MPLQSHPSCQGYRQGIEREINAGNKINEVGRAQDYGMDGRADSGMARPGFQWAAVSWQLEEGGRSGGVGGAMGEPAACYGYFTITASDGIVPTWRMFQLLSITYVNLWTT